MVFLIFHGGCGIPSSQFVKRQIGVKKNGSEVALLKHVFKLDETVLEEL